MPPQSATHTERRWPAKCSLFGSWEHVGPADRDRARVFWEQAVKRLSVDGVRVRDRERLCAVALTKRFAGPAHLAAELGLEAADLRFPDTATVAAACWLERAGIHDGQERREHGYWSGQWLHWQKPVADDDERVPASLWARIREQRSRNGSPPTYYAVIAMDGDRIGRWLAGAMTPPVRKLMHEKLRDWCKELDDPRVTAGLEARRHVTPALHATISDALGAFAVETAPSIVRGHRGTVIYSGGDDVLALCPVETSLACVDDLRRAFSGADEESRSGFRRSGARLRLTMGEQATMSAGLAIVHYKEDLRAALKAARDAEASAKREGRDRLRIVTIRRSGEFQTCPCPWELTPRIDELRRRFGAGASSRWAYTLREEARTLGPGLPPEANCAEIRRLVRRSEDGGRHGNLDQRMADLYLRLDELVGGCSTDSLADFTALCQTAAFMARGRDA